MTPEIIDSLQKRFGSADFSRYQVVRGQKYDFCRLLSAGTNSVSFFSNPIGATDPGAGATLFKTLEQTNLVKNASFGQEYFALTQIRTYANFVCQARQGFTTGTNFTYRGYTALTNGAMEQLQTVLNLGVLEISFAQKLYDRSSVRRLPVRVWYRCPEPRVFPHRQRCGDSGSRHELAGSFGLPCDCRLQHRPDPDHRARDPDSGRNQLPQREHAQLHQHRSGYRQRHPDPGD